MPLERTPKQEIQKILLRAQEIADGASSRHDDIDDIEPFLRAAEEVGIPREATLQALRERRRLATQTFAPGDIVFAPLEDRHLHAASVVSLAEVGITVRFVNGGERVCAPDDVQPVTALPGRKVTYKLGKSIWYSAAKVDRYDPVIRSVWLTSWAEAQPREALLSQIRVPRPRTARDAELRNLLWKVALGCGLGGTLIGLVLAHLFH